MNAKIHNNRPMLAAHGATRYLDCLPKEILTMQADV